MFTYKTSSVLMQGGGSVLDDILNALNHEGRNEIVRKALTQIQRLEVDRQLDKFNPENERKFNILFEGVSFTVVSYFRSNRRSRKTDKLGVET